MAESKKSNKAQQSPDVSSLGYAEALAELETILRSLEVDTVDVDELANKVQRAAALIRHCRGKIGDARVHVEQVVGEIDAAT
jgi:exodeoxyribonuclease VII small subunit